LLKRFLIIMAFACALPGLVLSEAHAQDSLYRPNNLKIVTTTGHIADLVHNIVGEYAQVESMMSTGSDPHLFRPTRSDLLLLKEADIIFYNGLHLEAQMGDVLERMGETKPVIALSSTLPLEDLIHEGEKVYDPHFWMNVNYWAGTIDLVVDTLTPFMPSREKQLSEAAEAYRQELDELDYKVQVAVASIPEEKRVLITAHDAFGYFGRAYGMNVIGIQGLSTESEAGIQHLENLIDLVIEHDIRAIFAETSVSPRNVEAIVEGAKARGHDIRIGAELFSDSLGPEGEPTDNYIGMMVHNVTAIAEELGGNASALKENRMEILRQE